MVEVKTEPNESELFSVCENTNMAAHQSRQHEVTYESKNNTSIRFKFYNVIRTVF